MSSVRARLTRQEQRELTRERLLDAASTLFARQGIAPTTVEQIAAEAGYTRGAVYSNFADKDELLVALVDRRVTETIAEVRELYEQNPDPDVFHRALRERSRRRHGTDEERVLWVELGLYALRNPAIRPQLLARFAAQRDAMADLIERQFRELGVPLPNDPRNMAMVVLALDEGLMLHRQLDPESHPEGLFYDALSDMLHGTIALARERERR